jgi:ATP-binding cassette, subfamily B, bacterial
MVTARLNQLSRWRALVGLLWAVRRREVVVFLTLLVVVGGMPTVMILLTGALVEAIPEMVQQGIRSASGSAALLSLGALVGAQAVLIACMKTLEQVSRTLDRTLALQVHYTVASTALAAPGVAQFSEPTFMDHLHAVEEADRRGVLRAPISELNYVASMRLRGFGAFVVLLAFQWWAPLVLAAAWHLTNLAYLRTADKAFSIRKGEGAARLRRADYLRSLALEAPAAKEIRVFGLGKWVVGEYHDSWHDAVADIWRNRRSDRIRNLAVACALAAAHAAVLAAMIGAVSRGELGVAALFVFMQAALATSDLGVAGDSQWWLAQALWVAEHVTRMRDESAHAPHAVASAAAPAVDKVAVSTAGCRSPVAVICDDVRFTYPGQDRPTLDGLTLHVPPGQTIAIVGENGAGKSTLIKLLCGLYEPDLGQITLDGEAPVHARDRVGVIFQDFVRYKLSLRDNVAFGHLGLLSERRMLERALEDAGGGALLRRLPRGWETVLSREFRDGIDLSGGEWQRVALARALTAVRGGAGLLILDEPTANLDVRAETALFEQLLQHTRDVTTMLVSHRLSSVRHADRIVVLDRGRIIEDGSHDTLMRDGRDYAAMFSLQAQRFVGADHAAAAEGTHA